MSSLFCALAWFQFKQLPKVPWGRKFPMIRKTKLFHMKNRTFLDVGPRPQKTFPAGNNDHHHQCQVQRAFIPLANLHIKMFLRHLFNTKQDSILLTLLPLEETDRTQHLLHRWSIVQHHCLEDSVRPQQGGKIPVHLSIITACQQLPCSYHLPYYY